jgi:hypothetical protein
MPGSLPHRHVGCACGLSLASVGSDVIPFERLLIYSHENYLYLKADCPKSAGIFSVSQSNTIPARLIYFMDFIWVKILIFIWII